MVCFPLFGAESENIHHGFPGDLAQGKKHRRPLILMYYGAVIESRGLGKGISQQKDRVVMNNRMTRKIIQAMQEYQSTNISRGKKPTGDAGKVRYRELSGVARPPAIDCPDS